MDTITSLGDWSAGRGPLHRKLVDALTNAIERGALAAGSRLPSERLLARDLSVSRSTVVAAYDGLRAAGLAESRHGSGTYVLATRIDPAARLDGEPSVGMPIFQRLLAGPDPDGRRISLACATVPAQPAIARAVATFPKNDLVALLADTGYAPHGIADLRAGVAGVLEGDGLPTEPDDIVITTGAHQAVRLCAEHLMRPGDAVVVENPTYPGCVDSFASAGARLISVPTDEDGMVVDELERILHRTTVAAIFTMPTFHNPTGTLMAERRRRQLVQAAARHQVAVVEDNTLSHVRLDDGAVPPPLGAFPGAERAPVITVGSLSKTLWGGLRVGWIRAPRAVLHGLARRKVQADLGSGVIDQAIAARVLRDFADLVAANTIMLRARLTTVESALREEVPDWRWTPPRGGPSPWVRLPTDAGPFVQLAFRQGVEVVAGRAFGRDGAFTDHIRIPFTCEPTVMAEAIRRLASAWAIHTGPRARIDVPEPEPLVV